MSYNKGDIIEPNEFEKIYNEIIVQKPSKLNEEIKKK